MRETADGLRADLEPTLGAIRVPTLLVRGADSRLVSPAAWAKTKRLRPDLPAIEVPGGDHYAPEEVHGPIADEIGRFWAGLKKGR
jgi:2-(acetamidomethylene)succinate hydrolase